MFGSKACTKIGLMVVIIAVQIVFSSPVMAFTGASGCGDDSNGDIGIDSHPITVQENQSSSYDFTHCFTGGVTTGWNQTQSPAPAHGTLAIVGSVVTYTPNTGYTGPDSYCLSCSPTGSLAGDGAQFDACSCNLTANFLVVAPTAPVGTPALGTWAMLLMALLLVAASLYRLRTPRCDPPSFG